MTADADIPNDTQRRVEWLISSGATDLPLPGAGQTAARWAALTAAAREDVVVGRLVEAHADADAILAELAGRRAGAGEWWGVWAAEPPTPRLEATRVGDTWTLTGGKAWCSGAGMCTHALITARVGEHDIGLYAVDLGGSAVTVDTATWKGAGMARSRTGTVTFDRVLAERVGGRSDYLERAGFWHGAIGVAACWLGGAERVADTLRSAARSRTLDPHALAHLGTVDAALAGARWTMEGSAAETDRRPDDLVAAHVRALRVRAVVEAAVALTVDRVGRALGAAPLSLDETHAGTVDDLLVYVRQSHAERDLASLGGLIAEGDEDV